jgi:hypothetical protein
VSIFSSLLHDFRKSHALVKAGYRGKVGLAGCDGRWHTTTNKTFGSVKALPGTSADRTSTTEFSFGRPSGVKIYTARNIVETAASTKGMLEIGVLSPADADRRDLPYLRVTSLIIEAEVLKQMVWRSGRFRDTNHLH